MNSPSPRRLDAMIGAFYILSLVAVSVCLAWLCHAARARTAEAYVRAVRGAVVHDDLSRAYQILRPGLREGFGAITVIDKSGSVRLHLSDPSGAEGTAWGLVRFTRRVPLNPRADRAGHLAEIEFAYSPAPSVILIVAASLVLSGVFALVRHLARKTRALTYAVQRAEQVAHDIRSPLSALSLTLGRGVGSPTAETRLIALALRRITEMTEDLMARSDVDHPAPSPATVDVARVVREVFTEIKTVYADRPRLRFELRVGARALWCPGDGAEYARVVTNLMTNAIEAVRSEGLVTVDARRTRGHVEVRVTDDGPGMPREVLARLGRERVTHGKNRAPGAGGLGLTHAYRVARAWGGRLRICCDAGTSATLTLPALTRRTPTGATLA